MLKLLILLDNYFASWLTAILGLIGIAQVYQKENMPMIQIITGAAYGVLIFVEICALRVVFRYA